MEVDNNFDLLKILIYPKSNELIDEPLRFTIKL